MLPRSRRLLVKSPTFSRKVNSPRYVVFCDCALPFSCVLVQREGQSVYNKVFEFPFDLNGTAVQMTVTSVSGHLTSQDFTLRFRNWHSCDPESLFKAPIETFVSEVSSAQSSSAFALSMFFFVEEFGCCFRQTRARALCCCSF